MKPVLSELDEFIVGILKRESLSLILSNTIDTRQDRVMNFKFIIA